MNTNTNHTNTDNVLANPPVSTETYMISSETENGAAFANSKTPRNRNVKMLSPLSMRNMQNLDQLSS